DGVTDVVANGYANVTNGVYDVYGGIHPGHATVVADVRPSIRSGIGVAFDIGVQLFLAVVLAPVVAESASSAGGAGEGGQILYRYRNGPETATRLGRQAAEAEANGFPHGVSTTTNPKPGLPCAAASCSDVGKEFPVIKTGRDPNHFTVELPKPVTK